MQGKKSNNEEDKADSVVACDRDKDLTAGMGELFHGPFTAGFTYE